MHPIPSPSRRWFSAALVFLTVIGCTVLAPARAGDYPSRPVQIIVGYAPGGGTDMFARVIAPALAKELGEPVVVRNAPGAGGQIAASALLREGADGHAILAINHPDLYMAVARGTAPFVASDFQVIMVDLKDPRIMLVRKDSELGSFDDFVARARAEPGKLSVSVAQGSAQELFARWLLGRLGLDVNVVGYRSGNESSNAVLSGEVAATIGDDYARLNIRDRTRALFVAARQRSPRWPEADTLETVLKPHGVSLPSPDFLTRYGIYVVPSAFRKDHPDAYRKLQQAMLDAREDPGFSEYLAKNRLGDLSIGKPGEVFEEPFAADLEGLKQVR